MRVKSAYPTSGAAEVSEVRPGLTPFLLGMAAGIAMFALLLLVLAFVALLRRRRRTHPLVR